jgi:NADP-dependent 3-hydroxy acid dehydrogenase YdfG
MKDKVIVITGASAGIGAALAKTLGQKGARLALLARNEAALNEVGRATGTEVLPVVTDVTRRADFARAIEATLGRFGRIDVLVNNAGRGISRMPTQLTDEDVDEMMLVNLKSVLYGMQAVLPHFQARGEGHIINISSMLGRVPFAAVRSAYCASKHALNALTACWRMELAQSHPGIHVSSVHPGVVATDFGLNARGGGLDSRQLPNTQTAEEVAEVIASVITSPRADVYTRPGGQDMIVRYYAAPDMAAAEAAFAGPPR